jgi:hypothetical protein
VGWWRLLRFRLNSFLLRRRGLNRLYLRFQSSRNAAKKALAAFGEVPRSRPGDWFDFNVIDTGQDDKPRNPCFSIRYNKAWLWLLFIMRRDVDKVGLRDAKSASMGDQNKWLECCWFKECAHFRACHSGKSTRFFRVEPNPFVEMVLRGAPGVLFLAFKRFLNWSARKGWSMSCVSSNPAAAKAQRSGAAALSGLQRAVASDFFGGRIVFSSGDKGY